MERRQLLRSAVGLGAWMVLRPAVGANAPSLDATIQAFTRGAPATAGRVRLEIASLIDNGNAVPVTIAVDSPMTSADHVRRIALFNEKNPERDVAIFTLGPGAGKAIVSTRIRLATSQRLVAVAELADGSFRQDGADVIVVLAACVEG